MTVKPGWIEDGSTPQDSKTTGGGTVITGVGGSVGGIGVSVGITGREVGVRVCWYQRGGLCIDRRWRLWWT
jgi:hypothetical protein